MLYYICSACLVGLDWVVKRVGWVGSDPCPSLLYTVTASCADD